jgi:hypothetical protein
MTLQQSNTLNQLTSYIEDSDSDKDFYHHGKVKNIIENHNYVIINFTYYKYKKRYIRAFIIEPDGSYTLTRNQP